MAASSIVFKTFRSPQTVIGRFVAKRTARTAALWGAAFGLIAASSAIGYVGVYTTQAARSEFAASFSNNVGIKAMIGAPHHLETVLGFTAWRSVGIVILVGAIWAIFTASKTFRGEETSGRWELFLTGQTTARRATANALLGLGASLVAMFVLVAVFAVVAGHFHDVPITVTSGLFFALVAVLPAAEFLAVGAVASQIQPTRSRAAAMTTAVFGLSFGLRAIGNITTSTHWLVNISPLGWVENLRPLTGSHAVWLLPIAAFTLILSLLSIVLAGKRDLGESIVADKDSARPHTKLLNRPFPAAWRLNRLSILPWLGGLFVFSTGFSALSKAASDAIKASSGAEQAIGRISGQSNIGATIFLGIVFLMLITVLMLAVATAVGNMREDEAEGYLDNLLVRPVDRLQWLGGRIALVAATIVTAGVLISIGVWIGASSVHSGVATHSIALAAINAMAPAFFMLGLGTLVFGFKPRLTSTVLYGFIAWSFVVQMLGSIGNLNHYILDTSILHHIALAPAVDVNWRVVYVLMVLGLAGGVLGAWRFNSRDLENE